MYIKYTLIFGGMDVVFPICNLFGVQMFMPFCLKIAAPVGKNGKTLRWCFGRLRVADQNQNTHSNNHKY